MALTNVVELAVLRMSMLSKADVLRRIGAPVGYPVGIFLSFLAATISLSIFQVEHRAAVAIGTPLLIIWEDPFKAVFFIAILASLWVQITVSEYFRTCGLLQHANTGLSQGFENRLVPLVASGITFGAILFIDEVAMHLSFSALFFGFLLIVDTRCLRDANAKDSSNPQHAFAAAEIKFRMSHLVKYDFLSIVPILLAAAVVWTFALDLSNVLDIKCSENIASDIHWIKVCDHSKLLLDIQHENGLSVRVSGERLKGMVRDAFITGVIGFHLFVMVAVLRFLMAEWDAASAVREADYFAKLKE